MSRERERKEKFGKITRGKVNVCKSISKGENKQANYLMYHIQNNGIFE